MILAKETLYTFKEHYKCQLRVEKNIVKIEEIAPIC